jgi:hypothetical protein
MLFLALSSRYLRLETRKANRALRSELQLQNRITISPAAASSR